MDSRNMSLDDSEGIAALDDGLLSASLDLILENEFCSYSKSQCNSLIAAALMHEEELVCLRPQFRLTISDLVLEIHQRRVNLAFRIAKSVIPSPYEPRNRRECAKQGAPEPLCHFTPILASLGGAIRI